MESFFVAPKLVLLLSCEIFLDLSAKESGSLELDPFELIFLEEVLELMCLGAGELFRPMSPKPFEGLGFRTLTGRDGTTFDPIPLDLRFSEVVESLLGKRVSLCVCFNLASDL